MQEASRLQLNPRFKCVLRIRCDDPTAKCPLGAKYGADMPEVPELLQLAKELGLQVIGVSFHVGSGCQDVSVYDEAIKRARSVFDLAEQQFGFSPLTLLDVGGGFSAPCDEASSRLFRATAATINAALDSHFPPGCGVDVISEPGMYDRMDVARRLMPVRA